MGDGKLRAVRLGFRIGAAKPVSIIRDGSAPILGALAILRGKQAALDLAVLILYVDRLFRVCGAAPHRAASIWC